MTCLVCTYCLVYGSERVVTDDRVRDRFRVCTYCLVREIVVTYDRKLDLFSFTPDPYV